MKKFTIFLGALICSSVFSFAGGSGTSADPYQIGTIADLQAINNDLTACYILLDDIDMSGVVYDDAIIATGYDRFTGTFDGNGHVISGLEIDNHNKLNFNPFPEEGQQGHTGLFGNLYSGANIFNIGIVDCNMSAVDLYIGALVGYNVYGTITNCYSTGVINGEGYAGGLIGGNHGDVSQCKSECVVGGNCVGGFAGSCYVASVLSQCYSTGNVTGTGECGGLVSSNQGDITNCFATGNTIGTAWGTGGLVGARVKGNISNCYSTGTVTGTDYVGGLIGRYYDSFISTVTSSYWDIETSNTTVSGGGIGLTTAQMMQQSSFTGWDFSTVWKMTGYPQFYWSNLPTSYTVTFDAGAHGAITAGDTEQSVLEGEAATAPEITASSGWIFTGWDTDFSNVAGPLTVTALYGVKMPNVTDMRGREAVNTLSEAGFTNISLLYSESSTVAKGYVAEQTPQAGQIIADPATANTEVTISMGPRCENILMADLTGDCVVNLFDLAEMADRWLFN